MDHSAEIVRVTSSFDALAHRDDTRELGTLVRKRRKRGTVATARRLTNVGLAIAALIAATIAFGLIVGPIGLGGLFLVVVLMVVLAVLGHGGLAEVSPKADERAHGLRTLADRLRPHLSIGQ